MTYTFKGKFFYQAQKEREGLGDTTNSGSRVGGSTEKDRRMSFGVGILRSSRPVVQLAGFRGNWNGKIGTNGSEK